MKEFNIAELEKLKKEKLTSIAADFKIPDEEIKKLKKQTLIFKILEAQAKKNGLLFSEGVLECLNDGFGFLRAPEFSYLPSQDDIYVSPSQIIVIRGTQEPESIGQDLKHTRPIERAFFFRVGLQDFKNQILLA